MMNNYDDIINLNRPISKHSHLSIESRASQFAPFAALVGYDEAVKETARLTDKRIEIDDGLKEMLNSKLNYINELHMVFERYAFNRVHRTRGRTRFAPAIFYF